MTVADIRDVSEADRRAWYEAGWWSDRTLADHVAGHAAQQPELLAYRCGDAALTWQDYDASSTLLASALRQAGFDPGDRLGVMLPDGPLVHQVFLAAEKAGVTIVGLGGRAGTREASHLLGLTEARGLVTLGTHRGASAADFVATLRGDCPALEHHVVVADAAAGSLLVDGGPVGALAVDDARALVEASRLGPDDVFLLNSTSGTTGMPKCVVQHQNRWWYFHQLATDAGELTSDDVLMSVIPAPFGFGLWTSHFTPAYLGATTVLLERFSAAAMLDAIERHAVTVLCCVSTQFLMLLNEQAERPRDLTSLRVMFTGGEAVPYERAAEFERVTGAAVLQFYGSNETGALSRTTVRDDRERRLRTAGAVIPEMQVRLFADDGRPLESAGQAGQPACKGPAICLGYYRDDAANEALFTEDGWMRIGDLAVIDDEGYLSVVGRTSDIIIRGGKNISAVDVENEIASHPGVAMVAVVGMPDPVFGERVCAYVVPRPGASIDLAGVVDHLTGRGMGKESLPERVEVVERLETASGGKVAKGALRDDIAQRLAAEAAAAS